MSIKYPTIWHIFFSSVDLSLWSLKYCSDYFDDSSVRKYITKDRHVELYKRIKRKNS